MQHPIGAARQESADLIALSILDYLHAPAVACYLVGAYIYALATLQKPVKFQSRARRIPISLMAILAFSYIAQALYYLSRTLADDSWRPPKHQVMHALTCMLVHGVITTWFQNAAEVIWHPYVGSFCIGLASETVLCILNGISCSAEGRLGNIPLTFNAARVAVALGLVVDGFLKLHRGRSKPENGTDEEGQSLLRAEINDTVRYGAIPENPEEGTKDGEGDDGDEDDEIKKYQKKRLEEAGSWLAYLKGFAIFIPCLWPSDDWKAMACLGLRGVNILQGRVFGLLVPRQIGIITDKLMEGSGIMPWRDIGLWTLYRWIDSYAGFDLIDSYASLVVSNYSSKRIYDLAFNHVMGLGMDFHTSKDSGEVLRSVEQAHSLESLIETVFFHLSPVLMDLFIAMYYISHLFDSYMALAILAMGFLYIWTGVSSTRWTQPFRRVSNEKDRSQNRILYESVSNWQTVSYFNRRSFERARFSNSIQEAIDAGYSYFFRSWAGYAFQEMILIIGFSSIVTYAISEIVAGHRKVGSLVTLMMYWSTMLSPMYTLAHSYRQISMTLVDAERLLQLLTTKPSIPEPDATTTPSLNAKDCKVEFKDVSFSYDERKPVLKNVTFTAEPGQTIAFVGETGGGKSTMLKLLFRFYDINSGSIQIDNQDIRSVTLSSLREIMGLVPQDPALFNQTIRENLRYARLDASDAEIEDACKAAAVHEKIMSFPDGYKTKVGERGVKLSGGELQRVAIARVLLKNPKIVCLDEATSAVDSATEALIQEAFKRLSAGRTTFVVAHRLSTIVDADLILVVDKGEIVERGTHAELLDAGGRYAELWAKQTTAGHSGVPSRVPSSERLKDGAKVAEELLIDVTPPEDDGGRDGGGEGKAAAEGRSDTQDEGGEGTPGLTLRK